MWRAPEGPEGLAAVPVGGGGAWPGFKPTHRADEQRPGPTGVEGTGGAGGPGCGARGRWRGLAGLRDDAPSEARGADGERAGSSPVEWCNRFVSFGLGYALSWSGGSSCWVGWGVSRDLVRMSRLR